MVTEAALIMICCVLFVQMGLSEAVQRLLHFRFGPLSCPKCLTFWTILAWLAVHGNGALISVAASFIASYCALWAALLYDSLAIAYNYLYEQITQKPDASEAAQDPCAEPGAQAPANEVSKM